MTIGVNIFIETESLWKMSKRAPESISEYPREPCAMFFLSKFPMWFFIMVIPQESLASSFKSSKVKKIMSSNDSLLPELIKTLNRGISSWFSLRDEYQMNSHEQMETNKLREAVRITSSTCCRHLIIHLGYLWKPYESPCFKEMLAQRNSLFTSELTCENCMPCHIHRMKGIESSSSLWTSEISGANNVCLMKLSHLLCFKIGIRLIVAISFRLLFSSLSMTGKDFSNSRNSRDIFNLSTYKLPMNNLCPDPREGRTAALMRIQFLPDGENLFNQIIRGFSLNLPLENGSYL